MSNVDLIAAFILVLLGGLCIYLGLRKRPFSLYGLRFRLLIVGIAAVLVGVILMFR